MRFLIIRIISYIFGPNLVRLFDCYAIYPPQQVNARSQNAFLEAIISEQQRNHHGSMPRGLSLFPIGHTLGVPIHNHTLSLERRPGPGGDDRALWEGTIWANTDGNHAARGNGMREKMMVKIFFNTRLALIYASHDLTLSLKTRSK